MKKLLKQYGYNSDMQYFEMIAENYRNKNIALAKEQFKLLPKEYKKNFIKSSILWWDNGIRVESVLNDFLPLV